MAMSCSMDVGSRAHRECHSCGAARHVRPAEDPDADPSRRCLIPSPGPSRLVPHRLPRRAGSLPGVLPPMQSMTIHDLLLQHGHHAQCGSPGVSQLHRLQPDWTMAGGGKEKPRR